MSSLFPEGNYRTFGTELGDTNESVVYTCPDSAAAAFVTWINISDTGANARTATIRWTDADASATFTFGYQIAIPANQQLRLELYLVLDPGDTLKITASAATLHVIVTVHEVAGRKA